MGSQSQPHFQEFLLFLFFGDQMLLEKAKSRHFPPVGVVRDAVSYSEAPSAAYYTHYYT